MNCLNIFEINALLVSALENIFSHYEGCHLEVNFMLFVYLAMSDLINSCGMWDLHCIMWDILLQCGLSSCM